MTYNRTEIEQENKKQKSRNGIQSMHAIMANATNKDIQFQFFLWHRRCLITAKIYSANKMEGDAAQSWRRMRDCADHNQKVKNVGSYKKMRAWADTGPRMIRSLIQVQSPSSVRWIFVGLC